MYKLDQTCETGFQAKKSVTILFYSFIISYAVAPIGKHAVTCDPESFACLRISTVSEKIGWNLENKSHWLRLHSGQLRL